MYLTLAFIGITLLLIVIANIRIIRNRLYANSCLRLTSSDEFIVTKYKPMVTFLNVMYFYITIPKELKVDDHSKYIKTLLSVFDESFLAMNLYGIIDGSVRFMDRDGNEDYMYLVKYQYKPRYIWLLINTLSAIVISVVSFVIYSYIA